VRCEDGWDRDVAGITCSKSSSVKLSLGLHMQVGGVN
jgi:hypothetical protein